VTMTCLVCTNASVSWLVLIVLTVLSWTLGTDHGFGPSGHTGASVVIIAVATFKIRPVGLYFMELKAAPMYLRGLFEGCCVALLGLLMGMYLFG
jgi:Prokaryotic Cytochrome C oxidase subunit IV